MTFRNFIFYLLFFLTSCNRQLIKNNCGVVTMGFRVQYAGSDTLEIPDITRDIKTWYLNSYIIQQIQVIKFIDSMSFRKRVVEDLYYAFLDLNTRNYFRYSGFSDTAKMIQCCYTTTDSLGIEYGWNFFYTPHVQKKVEFTPLSDTIINNNSYKRIAAYKDESFSSINNLEKPSRIYYFEKNKTDSMFSLNHSLTRRVGLPVTRIDLFDINKATGKDFTFIQQMTFVSNRLTNKELKVFAKWIENAKRFPVKYNAAYDSIYTPQF